MELAQFAGAAIAAVAALVGVAFGSRLTGAREFAAWTREQRLKAYADVLEAVDHSYGEFSLINAHLALNEYKPPAAPDPGIDGKIVEFRRWDARIDHVLPRAELVSSPGFQPLLSVGIRYGIRSRQHVLLMQLERQVADRAEWEAVNRNTLADLDGVRMRLRRDIGTDVQQVPWLGVGLTSWVVVASRRLRRRRRRS